MTSTILYPGKSDCKACVALTNALFEKPAPRWEPIAQTSQAPKPEVARNYELVIAVPCKKHARFDKRIPEVTEQAKDAFWDVVAKAFPEARFGDFPPDATFAFDDACAKAIDTWVFWNHPAPEDDDEAEC